MDLKRLDALVALAREGTVSAAATSLGCGQPTVSHHLRRLEEETGAVLVQRVGRGVRLTPDGARLAARGEEILGLMRRAEAELDTMTTLAAGHVRLAAFPSACSVLVPALLATLAETVPGMTLDLVEAEPPEAAGMLRSGEADVAITFAYAGQAFGDDIAVEHLGWDPLHLVEPAFSREPREASGSGGSGSTPGAGSGARASDGRVGTREDGFRVPMRRSDALVPGAGSGARASDGRVGTREAGRGVPTRHGGVFAPEHLADDASTLRPGALRELADARWIAGCERCRTGLLDLCASVDMVPDIGFASDDAVAVQALVAAGFGVTLLPALALAGHLNPGVVTRPVGGAGRELHVATYGAPPRPAAVEEVVQTLLTLRLP